MAKKAKKAAAPKKAAPKKAKKAVKKVATKKAAPKKAAKKVVKKKATPKKAAPKKKVVKKTVKKVVKKVAKKKVAPKKAVKKATPKKSVKKVVKKKAAPKKVTPKKKVVKKAVKKVVKKKVAPKKVVKKATPKKVVKKAAPKKNVVKKVVPKKVTIKKAPVNTAPAPKVVSKKEAKVKAPKESSVRNSDDGPMVVEYKTPTIHKPLGPTPKPFVNEDKRTRYSNAELKEFKELILKKLEEAKKDYDLLKSTLSHKDDHGTDDTSPTFKLLEDGSDVLSREETAHLASRQEKFIQNLQNALIRIENKTYGICRITGKLIAKERLRSVPHATLAIGAKLDQR